MVFGRVELAADDVCLGRAAGRICSRVVFLRFDVLPDAVLAVHVGFQFDVDALFPFGYEVGDTERGQSRVAHDVPSVPFHFTHGVVAQFEIYGIGRRARVVPHEVYHVRLSVLVAEVFETDVDIVAGECRRDDAYQVVPDAVAAVRVVFEQETLPDYRHRVDVVEDEDAYVVNGLFRCGVGAHVVAVAGQNVVFEIDPFAPLYLLAPIVLQDAEQHAVVSRYLEITVVVRARYLPEAVVNDVGGRCRARKLLAA